MKIYFDGCSWTYGTELKDKHQLRYSKLICNHYKAEEYNFSISGGSNDRIIRNLLVENNIEDYDLGIIQLSFPQRTEYYNDFEKQWKTICTFVGYSGNWLKKDFIKNHLLNDKMFLPDKEGAYHKDFWIYYYSHITNDVFFKTKEKIAYETVKSYFALKNIPLIIMSVVNQIDLEYDLNLGKKFYSRAKQGHPDEDGHKMIAEDIINIITSRQLL